MRKHTPVYINNYDKKSFAICTSLFKVLWAFCSTDGADLITSTSVLDIKVRTSSDELLK